MPGAWQEDNMIVAEQDAPSWIVRVGYLSEEGKAQWCGTGFFINSNCIVTCAHVVTHMDSQGDWLETIVQLQDGKVSKVQRPHTSDMFDLAVLETNCNVTEYATLEIAQGNSYRNNHEYFASGYSKENYPRISSVKIEPQYLDFHSEYDDASKTWYFKKIPGGLSEGFSGSPLCIHNETRAVVGINIYGGTDAVQTGARSVISLIQFIFYIRLNRAIQIELPLIQNSDLNFPANIEQQRHYQAQWCYLIRRESPTVNFNITFNGVCELIPFVLVPPQYSTDGAKQLPPFWIQQTLFPQSIYSQSGVAGPARGVSLDELKVSLKSLSDSTGHLPLPTYSQWLRAVTANGAAKLRMLGSISPIIQDRLPSINFICSPFGVEITPPGLFEYTRSSKPRDIEAFSGCQGSDGEPKRMKVRAAATTKCLVFRLCLPFEAFFEIKSMK